MSVLAELLRIKEFREEKAEMESARALQALDEATDVLNDAREVRDAYEAWKIHQERQLYIDMCSRGTVRLADLDDLALEVDLLRKQLSEHAEAVTEAEDARKAAFERRGEAQDAHHAAMRKREKFSELGRQAEADWLIELGRAEDLEMEEVPRRPVESDPADELSAMEAQA